MDSVLEQLRAAAARQGYVCVARDAVTERRIRGFVLAMSDELVLMQEIYDFASDGYVIVRLRDVTGVRDGDYERFDARVLAGEGIRAAPPSTAIHLASWRTVFESLSGGAWPLAVVEDETDAEVALWAGRVLAAGETSVAFHYVSPVGAWEAEPEEIEYDDVTRVCFGDRYTTVLARYTDG